MSTRAFFESIEVRHRVFLWIWSCVWSCPNCTLLHLISTLPNCWCSWWKHRCAHARTFLGWPVSLLSWPWFDSSFTMPFSWLRTNWRWSWHCHQLRRLLHISFHSLSFCSGQWFRSAGGLDLHLGRLNGCLLIWLNFLRNIFELLLLVWILHLWLKNNSWDQKGLCF